jgi:hypothetical protein
MCDDKRRGTIAEAADNLRQPLPLTLKLRLLARNNWRKLRTRSDCCGNYGEPGC